MITGVVVIGHVGSQRDEWLAERRKGITGTDAAILGGHSPWGSPLAVYLEKRGVGREFEVTDHMMWGSEKEAAILRFAGKRADATVTNQANHLIRQPGEPWIMATIDGYATHPTEGRCGAEVKGVFSPGNADRYKDGIPQSEIDQCQWGMLAMGTPLHFFAAEIMGRPPVWSWVERDEKRIAELVEAGREMMRRVEAAEPPEPIGSDADDDAIAAMHTVDPALRVELSIDAVEATHEIETLGKQIKDLQAREKAARQRIKLAMGDAYAGILPGDAGAWKRSRVERAGYLKVSTDANPEAVAEALRAADLGAFKVSETKGSSYTQMRRVKRV
jgi:putative phage-type endonuclease